jgi:hypothetical protein
MSPARKGHTRTVLVVAAIAVIAVAGAYVVLSQTEAPSENPSSRSSSTETASGSIPAIPVHNAVDKFFQDFNSRDVDGLVSFYYSGANVIWSGNAPGLTGGYSGTYAIMILYGSTVGKITQITTNVGDYAEKDSSPTNVNVTLTLKLNGTSVVAGRLNGTIDVSQQWAYSGTQWEIVNENWDYKAFDVQFPSSATTFPQWGVLKEGENPNIVSEKSFEWNAGPLVAAAVYSFLFAVVLMYAMRTRWNR